MSSYFTIEKIFTGELIVKDSKFIGILLPITSKEQFEKNLKSLWKEHPKARHICYAYILDDKNFKYYDDGEPNGTAGVRIYNALKLRKLSKCALFAIRYFGRTKLGTGPLAKAYFDLSIKVIDSAKIVEKFVTKEVNLLIDYSDFEKTKKMIWNFSTSEPQVDYKERILIKLFIESERINDFINFIKDQLSSGNIKIEVGEKLT